jgi:23S rRNA maturation mini-RNase III
MISTGTCEGAGISETRRRTASNDTYRLATAIEAIAISSLELKEANTYTGAAFAKCMISDLS